MDQSVKKLEVERESQFYYNGRWVDRAHFRAFVYRDGEEKLVKNYEQFIGHIATGWFESKEVLKAWHEAENLRIETEKARLEEEKARICRENAEIEAKKPVLSPFGEEKSPVKRISEFKSKNKSGL